MIRSAKFAPALSDLDSLPVVNPNQLMLPTQVRPAARAAHYAAATIAAPAAAAAAAPLHQLLLLPPPVSPAQHKASILARTISNNIAAA